MNPIVPIVPTTERYEECCLSCLREKKLRTVSLVLAFQLTEEKRPRALQVHLPRSVGAWSMTEAKLVPVYLDFLSATSACPFALLGARTSALVW